MKVLIVLLAMILGIGRLFITPRLNLPTAEGTYEAFAHLFVGGLIGACAAKPSRFYAALIVGLSLIELLAFLIQKNAA